MFCTNCGISNKNIAEFCFNCGESLGGFQTEEKRFLATVLSDGSFLRRVHFVQAFVDFSFNQLMSQKINKFLYGLSFLSAGLSALLFIIVGFHISLLFGIFSLFIGAPLIFLLMVLYSRVLLEMVLVISRMADRIANMGMASEGMTDREEKLEARDGIQWNI